MSADKRSTDVDEMFKTLLSDRCFRAIVVKSGRHRHRWACALPAGHEGDCARVTLKIRRFRDKPTSTSEVDSCMTVEQYGRARKASK